MIRKTRVFLIGIKNVLAVKKLIESMEIDAEMDVTVSVNNHGSPGDYDILKEFPYVTVKDTGNIGVAVGWNQGIIKALADRCEAIVLIPNDGYFAPRAFKSGLIHFYEFFPRDIGCYPHVVDGKFHPKSIHIDSCIYPLSLFSKVGLFDEMYRLCWYEDTDFLMRLEKLGLSIQVYEDCPYYNFPGLNRRIVLKEKMLSGEQLLAYRLMNNLYFFLKWGKELSVDRIKIEKQKIRDNMNGLTKAL